MSEPSPSNTGGSSAQHGDRNNPPTVAAFSPNSHSFHTKQRSTILVTRALAYSHPFIIPLNKLAGLLSWTTGDRWESFLFVALFWFTVLYGDHILRYAGPLVLVTLFILGMYLRRYSPLSSTGWTGEKKSKTHKRQDSDTQIKHRKSLDEILATLQTFTTRCNILLDPLLRMTDFLSTQQTATSATTRPALTTLFIRILLTSPLWIVLTLPPLRIITTKRIVLTFGTLVLSWHSRPARISRAILWRSRTVRTVCATLTGLSFANPSSIPPALPPRPTRNTSGAPNITSTGLKTTATTENEGIRFTFSLYENQRRWLGIGWTSSMLAYERSAWTDEHLNPTADPSHFTLPDVEGGVAKWRWVEGSEWHVEGTFDRRNSPAQPGTAKGHNKGNSDGGSKEDDAWIYYDNKWQDGRRGHDGWGRYTRRRKWVRDAELIDAVPEAQGSVRDEVPLAPPSEADTDATAVAGDADATLVLGSRDSEGGQNTTSGAEPLSPTSEKKRKGWFRKGNKEGGRKPNGGGESTTGSVESASSRTAREDDDIPTPIARLKEREADWGLGDEVTTWLG
ncbi:hypothetical protein H2203_000816 [Taxawa tesnikishii (nom. ined.)]|nr:hypothetical protein H2203_000816 [Dothideales sp. JES 119]